MSKIVKANKFDYYINQDGTTGMSRRALAKLCGVSVASLIGKGKLLDRIGNSTYDNQNTKNSLHYSLKPFHGQSFRGDNHLPDLLCAAIIKHYAELGKEQAQLSDLALTAVGVRVWIKEKAKEEYEGLTAKESYLHDYHGHMQLMKERECSGKDYGMVNGTFNKMVGVEKGERPNMPLRQRALMSMCHAASTVKLIDRPEDKKTQAALTSITAAKEAIKSLDYGDYPELLPY